MFEYLDGYEIDGSDTSFYVVMPDQEKLDEVVRYFLSIPLFNDFAVEFEKDAWAPHRQGRYFTPHSQEYILRKIKEHPQEEFYIMAGCIHPSELSGQVKEDVYSLSAERLENHLHVGGNLTQEEDFSGQIFLGEDSHQPSVGLRGVDQNLVMALCVNFERPERGEDVLDGYLINEAAYQETAGYPGSMKFEIICGPTFIYEYAMYVIKHLSARFPELVFSGGLDCEGGFLYGCTYAVSLYGYEGLTLAAGPEVESVADILTRLSEKQILFPCYKPKKMPGGYSNQYYVSAEGVATRINSAWDNPQNYTMAEYLTLLLSYRKSTKNLFMQKEECALMFTARVSASKTGVAEWEWLTHVTAYFEAGLWKVELHVPFQERERITEALKGLGMIE